MPEITYAWYGSKNGLSGANRTKVVQALFLSGKKAFTANNMTFGDPEPDVPKKLWITYKVDGADKTTTFAENDLVSFTSLT